MSHSPPGGVRQGRTPFVSQPAELAGGQPVRERPAGTLRPRVAAPQALMLHALSFAPRSSRLLTSCTPVRIQKARVYANRPRTVWSDNRDPSRPTQGPAARPAGVVTAAQKASRIAFHIVGKT